MKDGFKFSVLYFGLLNQSSSGTVRILRFKGCLYSDYDICVIQCIGNA